MNSFNIDVEHHLLTTSMLNEFMLRGDVKMWCLTSMLNEFKLRGDAKMWCLTSMLNEFMLRGDAKITWTHLTLMLNITF
jgi:hypothetical protein